MISKNGIRAFSDDRYAYMMFGKMSQVTSIRVVLLGVSYMKIKSTRKRLRVAGTVMIFIALEHNLIIRRIL